MLGTSRSTATIWLHLLRLSIGSRNSVVNLGSISLLEDPMADELLRASEAARRLGMPTKELLRLVHERKIR